MRSRKGQRGFRRAGDLSADRLEMPHSRARELRLATAWIKVAGEAIAHRAPVRGIKRGILEIEVPDERWAATLRELIPRLAGRLVAAYPDLGVKKFRLLLPGCGKRPRPSAIPPVGHADATGGGLPPVPVEEPSPDGDAPGPVIDRTEGGTTGSLEERLGRLADDYVDRTSRRDQKP